MKLIYFVALFFFGQSVEAVPESLKKSFVQITVSKQPVHANSPWQTKSVKNENHLGTYLGRNEVLITAYAVKDGSTPAPVVSPGASAGDVQNDVSSVYGGMSLRVGLYSVGFCGLSSRVARQKTSVVTSA